MQIGVGQPGRGIRVLSFLPGASTFQAKPLSDWPYDRGMENEIKPTDQDRKLVEKYLEETGRASAEGAEFAAWLRANYYVDAEHEGWF